ncbi:MAG: HNH endonuclease signature motif containing protein, partial [Bacilli bacterium]
NKEELFKSETNIQDNIQKEIKSVEEWINIRSVSQERNNSNKSSYLIEDEKSYIFYGKTFGANGRESIFILYLLAKLAKNENKKIYLYEVNDNGSSAIESSMRDEDKRFKKMLEHMGIIYYIDSVDYVENDNQEKILNEKDKDARHQAEFMRNLIIKFNAERDENGRIITNRKGNPIIKEALKKCYLCDCNIQKTIIASHIQRVTDINKLNISFEEKRKKATDADNGFWLCANHDKMFEYGIIIFDEKTGLLKMNLDNLNQEQINYIENVTKNTKVSMVHFTKQLKEYLKIHNDRIKMENNNYIINYSIIEKKSNLLEIAEEKIEYTVKEV